LRIGQPSLFPLSISGRYVVTAAGVPFIIQGDSAWSLEVQLTRAQILQYLDDRKNKGFNTILFEAIEHKFSSQTPAYKNVNGDNPFTSMTNFSTPNEPYWANVDFIVNELKKRGMAALIAPCYLGFGGGDEGWTVEMTADTAAHLQSYGAFLATRYTQGNIIWLMGGDYAGTTTERDKQWNIVTGMRSVRTGDLITAEPQRTDAESYPFWNTYTGWNLNLTYISSDGSDGYSRAATAYGRNMPFFQVEAGYEGERTLAEARRASYQTMMSGGCGHFFGNSPIWGFGEPNFNGGLGPAAALASDLNSTGAQQMAFLRQLIEAYTIAAMTPVTDTSLVTTSLGTGTGRVCPMLSVDNRVALIYTPSVNVTIDMSKFKQSSVRARWFDVTTGTYSADAASPLSNSGTHAFTAPGERVLVLD
jgi:hypothetical protein